MNPDRRQVLAGGIAALFAPVLGGGLAAAGAATGPRLLGARVGQRGGFFASAFDAAGEGAFDLPLPARGHGFAERPGRAEAVACARRPGTWLAVIDTAAGRILRHVGNAEGRRFNGHGVFSADGRLFYASESDHAAGRGVVGVYAADRGYTPVAAWDSGGLDPHDLRLLPDGRTLVVANGGIVTDPAAPRMKLNTGAMDSNLSYLDAATGRVLAQARPPAALASLGLRHLAIAADGAICFAAQYEGPAVDLVPLVGSHRPGAAELRFFSAPAAALRAMRHYCGSAAVDRSGRILGVSSPRGNRATFWDTADGRILASAEVADGCGIAPLAPGRFAVASGLGGVGAFDPATGTGSALAGALAAAGRWDNHLLALSG
ncbi:DUF1513 domain-containing protein [Stella sp.]|uniref:DUF1513 domain-containing protein n=1 Tax=Stella sp. TaxID=2912054 RepID=UPI0035B4F708